MEALRIGQAGELVIVKQGVVKLNPGRIAILVMLESVPACYSKYCISSSTLFPHICVGVDAQFPYHHPRVRSWVNVLLIRSLSTSNVHQRTWTRYPINLESPAIIIYMERAFLFLLGIRMQPVMDCPARFLDIDCHLDLAFA